MKTCLFLLYLVAPVIAGFTYPNWIDGKIFWPKGKNVTVRRDSNWPIWVDGPVSAEILDLRITTYTNNVYIHKLAELTDVRDGGEWDWTVDVPDEFTNGESFVFRSREHHDGNDYTGNLWHYPSQIFAVSKALEPSPLRTPSLSTSSSKTSSSGAASTAISNSTTTSSEYEISTAPETPNTETTLQVNVSVSHGTSPGVMAGAVVGSLVGIVAIVGAVVLGLRGGRIRGKGKATTNDPDGTLQEGAAASAPATPMAMEYNSEKYSTSDLPEWIVPNK